MNADAMAKPKRANGWLGLVIVMAIGLLVLSSPDLPPIQVRFANWMPQSRQPLSAQDAETIRRLADSRVTQNITVVEREEDGSVIVMAGESMGSMLRYRKLLGFWVMTEESRWIE